MVDAVRIGSAVHEAVCRAATGLRPDVLTAMRAARDAERSPRGVEILDQLLANAEIALSDRVPLCQDTGTVWVLIEVGPDVCLAGDVLAEVDRAVERAYRDRALRMSVVRDALFDRSNTGTNTPAFVDIVPAERPGVTVSVMLKGGGSDNASVVAMLDPAAGEDGVLEVVIRAVEAKGASACPPLLIGVGVGATFDKVAGLAKKALLREVGSPARDAANAAFEARLLDAVNATGIGPGGFGGTVTALGVHVVTAPCHIAAMPVAVNIGCCAVRTATVTVS